MTALSSGIVGTVIGGVQPNDEGKEFSLGNSVLGANGRKYVLVEASAGIAALAAGREVTITEPAFTAATGSGGFRAPEGVELVAGEHFWAMEKVLGNGT